MGSEIVCGYKLVRQLGARALPSYAAIDPKPRRPEDALCVVERLARKTSLASGRSRVDSTGENAGVLSVGAEAAAEFLRDAKRLTQLKHPNLVKVREVVLGTSTVLVVMDWIEGEVFSDIQRMAKAQDVPIPLGGSLRIVVDLLEGLSALHEVCDAKRERLQIVHAEVAPRNVVVGTDGRAVLVHPLRAPAGTAHATRSHGPAIIGYLAPEVLLGDQTADQRADVYGAGVMLWEALAGHRMHGDDDDPGEIVMRLLGGKIAAPTFPTDSPWAAPLVEVARRAVSPDPSTRFPNATAMLAEVRRVAGARLAPKLTVAALVEAVAGARIRVRTAALVREESVARGEGESAWTTEAPTVNRQGQAHLLDLEAAKRTPLKPPPMPPLEAAMHPASTPTVASPVSAATRDGETPPRRAKPPLPGGSRAIPLPSAHAARTAQSAGDDEIDVEIELAAPSPAELPATVRPPASNTPPPPTSRSRFDTTTETKTDLAAALASAPPPSSRTARWTIAVASAIGAGALVWMILRATSDAPAAGMDPPAPSGAATARAESPASATAEAPATAPRPGGETSPEPLPPATALAIVPSAPDSEPHLPDRGAPARASAPISPPIPTVSSPPPASAPVQPSPTAAPAASSTHPKKRVYDPMGI